MAKKPIKAENCENGSCAPVNAVSKEGIMSLLFIFAVLVVLFLIVFVLNGGSLNF